MGICKKVACGCVACAVLAAPFHPIGKAAYDILKQRGMITVMFGPAGMGTGTMSSATISGAGIGSGAKILSSFNGKVATLTVGKRGQEAALRARF